ncbi:MAG: hypothetical protein WA702_17385 [Bradyrhizobium sp.]|uniref:hypothetical protein n=1 Tax=Bradyrhizobium sp. TaxID=376 RepID=UPI003C7994C1
MSRVDVNAKGAGSGPPARARAWIESLGPYQSLLLLVVPACLVEPMKLAALAVAGEGHWITGTGLIVAAYAASLLLVERLFLIVKPKLLTLPWFASVWARFVALRAKAKRSIGWGRGRPMEKSHERLL